MNLDGKIAYLATAFAGWLLLPLLSLQAATYQDSLFVHKFVNYSVEEGLPSSVVYDVLQDSLGFMWFATESGVSRFDGYEFENFGIEDGLPDNDIIGFTKDPKGFIWFHSLSGIGYCIPSLKPEFHTIPGYDQFAFHGVVYFHGKYIFQLSKEYKGQLIFYDPATQEKTIKEIPYWTRTFQLNDTIWRETGDGFTVIAPTFAKDSIMDDPHYRISTLKRISPNLVIFNSGQNFKLFDGQQVQDLPGKYAPQFTRADIQCMMISRDSTLWVSSRDRGLYCLPLDCESPPKVFPEFLGTRFSNIAQDREGNTWITSLTDGIFFLSKFHAYQKNFVPAEKSMRKRIQTVANLRNKQIALGTANAEVLFLGRDGIKKLKWGAPYLHERIRGIVPFGEDTLMIYGDSRIGMVTEKATKLAVYGGTTGIKDVSMDSDHHFWFGASTIVGRAPFDILRKNTEQNPIALTDYQAFGQRTVTILKDKQNPYLFAGNPAGLRAWKVQQGELVGPPHDLLAASILDINQSPTGDLWISTDGEGVLVIKNGYSPSHFAYQWFSVNNGMLPSNTCKRVIFRESNEVWIGTNQGVSIIRNFSWEKPAHAHETDHLNAAHGLLSDNINDLAILGDSAYVGTDKGLTVFDLEGIKNRKKLNPSVVITAVKILERDTTVQDYYELDYHHRNIKIKFISFAYASQGNIHYQYKMEPLEKNWIPTRQTYAHYPTLDPGDYVFKVKAIDNDGMESQNLTEIKLRVAPIWWNTLWFKLCALVLALLLFGAIYSYRVRSIRKQARLKTEYHREIAEYQRQTLSSQMNPHFIFNALVAVQHFILKSDGRSANKYLAKFSKLIRNVLEGSQHKTIPLSEEIRTLELYLELEHLRFRDRFQYEINVAPEIFPGSIPIPPMILQPFVENAIRHGLKPLQGDGKLVVSFHVEEEYLTCIIEDNGVGRKKAVEFKGIHHTEYQSRGMELTMKRIDLLNYQQEKLAKVSVEDLVDDQQHGTGTRITVIFPLH